MSDETVNEQLTAMSAEFRRQIPFSEEKARIDAEKQKQTYDSLLANMTAQLVDGARGAGMGGEGDGVVATTIVATVARAAALPAGGSGAVAGTGLGDVSSARLGTGSSAGAGAMSSSGRNVLCWSRHGEGRVRRFCERGEHGCVFCWSRHCV